MSETPIRLVLADVDGTLVTPAKELTDETRLAVKRLEERGILFAVTSSRPPRGLAMLIDPLDLTTPLGGYNGGLIVDRDMRTLHELTIDEDYVGPIIETLLANSLSIWVYQGNDWFVSDLKGPHVEHEATVVQFEPTQLDSFDGVRSNVIKIVGVSDDPTLIAAAAFALYESCGTHVSATTSQTYYLDITHQDANKGSVVDFLAKDLSFDRSSIATIGDMTNDISMFQRSGLSIAMGNATDQVKKTATHVTESNADNGFAFAIEHFVLNQLS